MTDRPIEHVLARLEAVRTSDDRNWIARCPAHDDRNPSLSVGVGAEGRVLLKCHAGCDHRSILEALELSPRDLFAESPENLHARPSAPTRPPKHRSSFGALTDVEAAYTRQLGVPSTTWDYHDASGVQIGRVLRWDTPTGKTIRCAWKHGNKWSMSPPTIRPLYRLDHIADLDRVFIVEGEKAADRLAALGFEATTSSGGSSASPKANWASLKATEVVILPDADEPGAKYAESVATALTDLVPDRTVVVLPLEGLKPGSGDDMVEWVDVVHAGDEEAAAAALELASAMALSTERRHRPLLSAAEILQDPYWKKPPPVIRTGVPWFDDIQPFEGLERGSVTILAAPPRCYKTSLLLFLAWQLAETGHRVHYLAGEMTRTALLRRIVAMVAEVSPNCVADSQIPGVRERVADAEHRLREFQDRLTFGRAPVTLHGIEASVRAADVVVVDYLQLIQPGPDHVGAGRVDELDAAMRVVLSLAQQGGTIIAAASLNRQNRDSLSLSAIRGSSSIEYGATAIYATTEDLAGVADDDVTVGTVRDVEYRCLKQREGTPKPLRFRVDLLIGPLPIEPSS